MFTRSRQRPRAFSKLAAAGLAGYGLFGRFRLLHLRDIICNDMLSRAAGFTGALPGRVYYKLCRKAQECAAASYKAGRVEHAALLLIVGFVYAASFHESYVTHASQLDFVMLMAIQRAGEAAGSTHAATGLLFPLMPELPFSARHWYIISLSQQ